jgi:hypothetical protein
MSDYLPLNAKSLQIKEQIINDDVSGLTLIFKVAKTGKTHTIQIISPILPFGNREFQFVNGRLVGTGTNVTVWRWVKGGKFDIQRVGREVLIPKWEVDLLRTKRRKTGH